jgi:hypothetical protein
MYVPYIFKQVVNHSTMQLNFKKFIMNELKLNYDYFYKAAKLSTCPMLTGRRATCGASVVANA